MANGLTFIRKTVSVADTQQLAATLAAHVRSGDVIVLNGDLGAGKTHFVQGVAKELEIPAAVTSPTFNIVQSYEGGMLPMKHFDLYRLEQPEELDDIGYWEELEGEAVSFIEWGDRFPNHMPLDFLEIGITVDDDGCRAIRARSYGERARRLLFIWSQDANAGLKKIEGF